MAGTVPYRKFGESYLTAEVNTISQEAGWNRSQFAVVTGKSGNTIKAWMEGGRIPDKANLAFICEQAGIEPARKQFILHVREQLHRGSELVSDLDNRNLYIVESAERTYPIHIKWDPLLPSALLQTEALHMKLLADPMDDPANKVKTWKRKVRRAKTFFGRFKGASHPRAELYTPSSVFTDFDRLTRDEKEAQIKHMLWVDSLPGCEVLVVQPPHLAGFPFDAFKSDGQPGAAPDFVYVENLDQSRHVVEEEKLALYDQARSFLRTNSQGIGRFLDGGVHRLAQEHPQ